jgi:hypothetical protein
MQTPPPFPGYEGGYQAPQKPKKNPVLIVLAIFGVLTICCIGPIGFVGFFGYKGFKGAMSLGGCFVNAGVITEATKEYVAKNGKYPEADKWQTELAKYIKTDEKEAQEMRKIGMNVLSANGEWSCDNNGVKTGFAFNKAFSGKKASEVTGKDGQPAIVIFETTTVAYNQNSEYKPLPFDQSPNVMGDMVKEKRGWIVITGEGGLGTIDKSGKFSSEMGKSFKLGLEAGKNGKNESSNDSEN